MGSAEMIGYMAGAAAVYIVLHVGVLLGIAWHREKSTITKAEVRAILDDQPDPSR